MTNTIADRISVFHSRSFRKRMISKSLILCSGSLVCLISLLF